MNLSSSNEDTGNNNNNSSNGQSSDVPDAQRMQERSANESQQTKSFSLVGSEGRANRPSRKAKELNVNSSGKAAYIQGSKTLGNSSAATAHNEDDYDERREDVKPGAVAISADQSPIRRIISKVHQQENNDAAIKREADNFASSLAANSTRPGVTSVSPPLEPATAGIRDANPSVRLQSVQLEESPSSPRTHEPATQSDFARLPPRTVSPTGAIKTSRTSRPSRKTNPGGGKTSKFPPDTIQKLGREENIPTLPDPKPERVGEVIQNDKYDVEQPYSGTNNVSSSCVSHDNTSEELIRKSWMENKLPESSPPDDTTGIISATIVDENELAKEFQKEFLGNIVEAAEVIPAPEQSEGDTRENKRSSVVRGFCFLVVLGVVLAIVLSVTGKDSGDNSTPLPTEEPTLSPTLLSDAQYLYEFLYHISGQALDNTTTPQFQAYQWMAYEDPLKLDFRRTNMTTLRDRYVIATLYFSTGGAYWTDQAQFLTNTSVCNWQGDVNRIRCNDDGEVFRIFVDQTNASGTLPPEIGQLTNLDAFSMLYGGVTGTIPSEYGQLRNCKFLQLSSQLLTGSIPQTFNSLSTMEIVNFYDNQLTGPIPSDWYGPGNASQLRYLLLALNHMTGTLPEFRSQSQLEWVYLDDNMFEGPLPSSVYSQPNLEQFEVANNMLNGTISPAIGAWVEISMLHLNGNHFSGSIPTQIAQTQDLEDLDLKENQFTGTIPSELGELTLVKKLDLSFNQFSGTIPSELALLQDLTVMHLASNALLSGIVPSEIASLPSLVELSLQGTGISAGLEEYFCNRTILTTQVEVDCGGLLQPQVECSCCTQCCDGGENCTTNVQGICNTVAGGFEISAERQASCECTDSGEEIYCTDTCTSCNLDGTVCAQNTNYGYVLDALTGSAIEFRNTLQYTLGRNTSVFYSFDLTDSTCEVEVNGEKCRICDVFVCPSGFEGFQVLCDNLENGFNMDSCTVVEAGYLDVFYWIDPSLGTGCPPLLYNDRA